MAKMLNEIKKSVSFIFTKNNKEGFVPNGTGFFIGIKSEKTEGFHIYFVTAKHVLQNSSGDYHKEILLRLNNKSGSAEFVKLKTDELKILEHKDKNVDIALFHCIPNETKYDYRWIPQEIISNKELIEKNEIAEGDDVFFAGLFTSHIGQKKNQPIIRFGKVALMSEEKIEWKEKGKPPKFMDLHLLECQSFGGNSGSPVFFHLKKRQPLFLAGVMTGSFLNGNEIQIIQNASRLVSLQNLGIAAVTPADKLHEILFSEEAIKLRKQA